MLITGDFSWQHYTARPCCDSETRLANNNDSGLPPNVHKSFKCIVCLCSASTSTLDMLRLDSRNGSPSQSRQPVAELESQTDPLLLALPQLLLQAYTCWSFVSELKVACSHTWAVAGIQNR